MTEANEPGYRGYLYNWLVADSLKVDFVGVNKKMPTNGGDEDHSGFGGFVIGPGASRTTSYCSPLGREGDHFGAPGVGGEERLSFLAVLLPRLVLQCPEKELTLSM